MNATPNEGTPLFPQVFDHPGSETVEGWMNVIHGSQLSPNLTAVAEALAAYADPHRRSASPGRRKLSEETGLALEEVSAALKTLQNMQLLELPTGNILPGQVGLRYWFRVPDEKCGLAPCGEKEKDAERLSQLERDLLLRPAEKLVRESIGITLDKIPGVPPTHDEVSVNVSHHSRVVKPASKRKGIRRQETVLYHYYDDSDVLLYVGITSNMFARTSSHEADSTWMDFAARSTIEHFPDRDDALEAERAAIEEKRPLFNVEHNDYPDRVARLVDYLIDRDRRDLLVPLISRG